MSSSRLVQVGIEWTDGSCGGSRSSWPVDYLGIIICVSWLVLPKLYSIFLHFPTSKSHPLVSVISRANSFVYLEVLIPLLKIKSNQTWLYSEKEGTYLVCRLILNDQETASKPALSFGQPDFTLWFAVHHLAFFYPYEQTVPSKTRRVLSFQSDLPVLKIWDLIFSSFIFSLFLSHS